MKRTLSAALLVALLAVGFAAASPAGAQTPVWMLQFYPNPDWAGYPVATQYASTMNFNWGTSAPASNMPADNWTMISTRTQFTYAGTYEVSVTADDEVVLLVDGRVIINTVGAGLSGKQVVAQFQVSEGNHAFELRFREFTGAAYVLSTWRIIKQDSGGSGGGSNPSLAYPFPPASATSVQTQFGDYTPCIQANSHQVNCFVSDGQWNSPDQGSISMEPQITVWGNCQPADSDTIWTTNANVTPPVYTTFRCSKTLAGWFPR